jgi:hypothetical protein
MVYNCSMVFLLEYHPHIRVASDFNGTYERTQRPKTMTYAYWNREYDTKKDKEMVELFDSNGETMFDEPECFDTYIEKIPIGMERKFMSFHIGSILIFATY